MKLFLLFVLSTYSQLINAQSTSRANCIVRCSQGSVACVDFRSGNSVKETTEPYIEMIKKIKSNTSGDYLKSKCNLVATIGIDKISFRGDSCLISQKISFWDYLFETEFPSSFSGEFINVTGDEFQINFNSQNSPKFSYSQKGEVYSSGPIEFITNYKNHDGIEYIMWFDGLLCYTSPY